MIDFYKDLLTYFDQHALVKTLSKDEILLKEGQVETRLYFIDSGAIRVFLLSEYEEVNIRFGYSGSIINSLASFLKQEPSAFYIEALRKTTVKVLSRDQLLTFINQSDVYRQG